MPHFNVECSENVLSQLDAQSLAEAVHRAALSTELFAEDNIQIKVKACDGYFIGGKRQDFVSVFASILGGRSAEQKTALSKAVVLKLCELLPAVDRIHVNVTELQKGTGFSRSKL